MTADGRSTDRHNLGSLADAAERYAADRQWIKFHTPKNLVMALVGEVGELAAEFQWLTPDESYLVMSDDRKRRAVEDEIADVVLYLLRLADVLGLDLSKVGERKLARNEDRYPTSLVRGAGSIGPLRLFAASDAPADCGHRAENRT